MKVAINGLIIDNQKAGIGHYGYNLISHMGKIEGIDCTVFLQKSVDIMSANITKMNDYDKSYKRILTEQISLPHYYRNFDLVHFIDYSSPVHKINTPFITTIHDLAFYKYPDTFSTGSRKIKEILAPLSIKRAKRIIADSISTKNDIIDRFPYAEDKIKVIYPGIEIDAGLNNVVDIGSVKLKYGINGRYILAVGTVEPRKNLIRLIEAFEQIERKHTDLQLVLTGKLGWVYDDILLKARSLASRGKLVMTGYVSKSELTAIYQNASCFVYPSIYEGFGLPPLEAMANGTPVVISNTSSLPEVAGDAGYYINPLDVVDIVNGIEHVLEDRDLAKMMVEKGYEQVEKFKWEKTASEIADIYTELKLEL